MSTPATNTRPFLFERDLGAEELPLPGKAGARPAMTPEETVETALSKARADFEKKLKKAEEEAYRCGLADGRAQGIEQGRTLEREDAEAETRRNLAVIANQLTELKGDLTARAQSLEEEAGTFVARIVAKLLPGLEAKLSDIRLERFVRDALVTAQNSPAVVLRLPADSGDTEQTLQSLIAEIGHAGTVEIKRDPALNPGAVAVSWGGGGISLDPTRTAREIVEICRRELGGPGDDDTPPPPSSSGDASIDEVINAVTNAVSTDITFGKKEP
ncbi:hypothetical protein [Azospirillum sp. SYSU D00513]|uniref:FliH/SctL family protein n=1 Tax=Azospirillum sp. SYSU D00513 TaxID=2812561 RepID=UPI001A957B07|nr:hypothetical protein [Azospirillum sp. SYSU D00513]